MGFFIFMLIMDMLVPIIMIGFGRNFMNNPPKHINRVYGYRTAMSMKNNETWEFAHKYFGRLWFILGKTLLAASIIILVITFLIDNNAMGFWGGVLCYLQIACMLGAILPTERALRKRFDENGNKRDLI